MSDGPRHDDNGISARWWALGGASVLLVLTVTVVALHTPVYREHQREEAAAREIVALGGRVGWDAGRDEPPRWPLSLLGESYARLWRRVERVERSGLSVTDAGLGHIAGLTNLEWLDLNSTHVTDAGLAHLAGLTNLEALGLGNTQVTDAGLAHLAGLTNLKRLWLGNTQVTDAGLAHLAGLTELQGLDLRSPQVTDAGLAHLAGLTKLGILYLRDTQVTDAGVASLRASLPSVEIDR